MIASSRRFRAAWLAETQIAANSSNANILGRIRTAIRRALTWAQPKGLSMHRRSSGESPVMRALWLTLLLLVSLDALAYFSSPRTEPPTPIAGRPFDVLIDVGECHGFTAPFPGEPGPRLEVAGSVIRVFEPGVITLGCVLPPATLRRTLPPLDAGDYVVEVHMIRLPQQVEVMLSSARVTVVGAPTPAPRTVPSLSIGGLLMLAALALILAARSRFR